MDKNKSQRLKEILNQTLTSEEIEKKLIEERDSISQKKENTTKEPVKKEIKENEISDPKKNPEKKLQSIEKKVVIPTVRDKKVENTESNLLLYLVSIIAILVLILTIYLFTKDSNYFNTKSSIKDKNIEKVVENTQNEVPKIREVVETEVSKVLEEKKEETLFVIEKETDEPLNEVKTSEDEIKTNITSKIEDKKDIEIKEKIITKVVPLNKQNFKDYYNSTKFNSLKCYNFKAGNVFPDAQCKKDLKKFIDVNKNALRFEVIPVMSEDDSIIFKKIKQNLGSMDESFQNKVKEYMFRGLSRERVLETSWFIKDVLGDDTILTPTNYYVNSKKNNKGIIVKAYH